MSETNNVELTTAFREVLEHNKQLNTFLNNHLAHIADDMAAVKTDMAVVKTKVSFLDKFFWLVSSVVVTAILGAVLALVLKTQ